MSVWFGIFGGPAAWLAQELVGWLVSLWACPDGEGSRAPQLVISAVAVAVAAAALWAGLRAHRALGEPLALAIHSRSRSEFLASAAILVSAASLVAIALTAWPQIVLPICNAVR